MTTIITVQRGSDSFIAADTRVSMGCCGAITSTSLAIKVIPHRSGKAYIGIAGDGDMKGSFQEMMDEIINENNILEEFFKKFSECAKDRYFSNSIIGIENGASYNISETLMTQYEYTLQAYGVGSGGDGAIASFNTLTSEVDKYRDIANLDDETMKELLIKSIVNGAKSDPYTNEQITVYKTTKEYEPEDAKSKYQLSDKRSEQTVELPMVIATNEITAKNQQYSKKSLQEVVNMVNSKEIAVMIDHGDNATYGKQELGVWKNAKLIEKSSNCFEVYATAVMKKTPLTQSIVEQKSIFGASMRCLHPQGAKMSNGCEIVEEIKDVLEISLTENPTMSETRSLRMALEGVDTRKDMTRFLKHRYSLSNGESELLFSRMKAMASKEFQGNLELTAQQGNLVMASEVELMKQKHESEVAELKSNLAKSQNDLIRRDNIVADLMKFVNNPLKN